MPHSTCLVAGCLRPVHCRKCCEPHYRRLLKYGNPTTGGPVRDRFDGTPEERFWPRVNKSGSLPAHRPELGPCWMWTGDAQTDNGYPQFRIGGRMVLVHRFAYELLVNSIPASYQIDHNCHNQSGCPGGPSCPHRRCVNPNHLDLVTNDENQERRIGMHAKDNCIQGHIYDDENTGWTGGKRYCRKCARTRFKKWAAKSGRKRS